MGRDGDRKTFAGSTAVRYSIPLVRRYESVLKNTHLKTRCKNRTAKIRRKSEHWGERGKTKWNVYETHVIGCWKNNYFVMKIVCKKKCKKDIRSEKMKKKEIKNIIALKIKYFIQCSGYMFSRIRDYSEPDTHRKAQHVRTVTEPN